VDGIRAHPQRIGRPLWNAGGSSNLSSVPHQKLDTLHGLRALPQEAAVAPPDSGAPLRALRDAAQAQVDATSLRQAASDIGMSPTGLRGFLDGAEPYLKTERKLRAWFTRRQRKGAPETVTPDVAQVAVTVLVEHLPARGRPAAIGELLDVLERGSRVPGVGVPRWIGSLRDGG
jgi:hypothetical protein